MKRTVWVVALIVVIGLVAGLAWLNRRESAPGQLVAYGNVDLRQVQLSFNNSERIAAVLVEEGDRVRKDQLVARLDTRRLEPQVGLNDKSYNGSVVAAVPKRSPRRGPTSSRSRLMPLTHASSTSASRAQPKCRLDGQCGSRMSIMPRRLCK